MLVRAGTWMTGPPRASDKRARGEKAHIAGVGGECNQKKKKKKKTR